MIQELITYCILIVTVIIAVVKVIRFFNQPVNKCSSCAFATGQCKIAPLKKK